MSRKNRDSIASNKLKSSLQRQSAHAKQKQEGYLSDRADEILKTGYEISLHFQNTWQTRFVLALLLVNAALSVTDFAQNVEAARPPKIDPLSEEAAFKAKIEPQNLSAKVLLAKVNRHLSNNFTAEEKTFIAEAVITIPKEERGYYSHLY